jgi:RNA polymerase subunit RPABC4/transcription elongation factor Spt4
MKDNLLYLFDPKFTNPFSDMKTCPHCKAEVDDEYELCWNCQYSFADRKVLTPDDFRQECPSCKAEVDPHLNFCPSCKHDLSTAITAGRQGVPGPVKKIGCLRCGVPMSFNGNYRFHEGTRMGALGDLFELFTNRESFDLYFCPQCGKVEFFLPEV